jgi:hypothetical protein
LREPYANIRLGDVRFVVFFLLWLPLVHHISDRLGCGSSFGNVSPSKLGVSFGDLM